MKVDAGSLCDPGEEKKRIQPVRSNIIQFQRLIQASTDDLCLACELQSLGRETVLICNRQRVDEAGP
jgi:hypothetical protein